MPFHISQFKSYLFLNFRSLENHHIDLNLLLKYIEIEFLRCLKLKLNSVEQIVNHLQHLLYSQVDNQQNVCSEIRANA